MTSPLCHRYLRASPRERLAPWVRVRGPGFPELPGRSVSVPERFWGELLLRRPFTGGGGALPTGCGSSVVVVTIEGSPLGAQPHWPGNLGPGPETPQPSSPSGPPGRGVVPGAFLCFVGGAPTGRTRQPLDVADIPGPPVPAGPAAVLADSVAGRRSGRVLFFQWRPGEAVFSERAERVRLEPAVAGLLRGPTSRGAAGLGRAPLAPPANRRPLPSTAAPSSSLRTSAATRTPSRCHTVAGVFELVDDLCAGARRRDSGDQAKGLRSRGGGHRCSVISIGTLFRRTPTLVAAQLVTELVPELVRGALLVVVALLSSCAAATSAVPRTGSTPPSVPPGPTATRNSRS